MGFYYCNSRYYDPEVGRWINADAAIGQIGNVQGTNMFAYCFNNPLNMSDPTGNWPKNHTVYGLQDPSTGKIEYVGRTTDPAKRAAAHKSNAARQHLEMVPLATGLNAIETRGVEQIQMLEHHTINTANKMNNQINGISPFNRKLGVYMEAGRGTLSYLENQISNEILY